MMTRDEAADLLTFIQGYDNRAVTAQTVSSWQDAAERGRWTFDEAVEAVAEHYARTTAHLMPGHITEAVRQRRQQPPPLPEQRRREIGRPAPADPQTVRSCVEEISRQLGWDQEMDRRSVLARRCPFCGSAAGEQCTRPARRGGGETRVPLQRAHPARIEAAEDYEINQEAGR